ncbi:hypothetical protein Nepgr_018487 [Nepenthes gracilis]|uniref:RING-type E3 ubiquitin transferase n=1 Tax=Nepenthes gracilis TaxID=150966 RepID=A0AAD3STR5_NEPGR|nr:hypothetical protein Nepgr_018487 [Nepenthes gracilis]
MQGHKSAVGSLPDSINFECGSTSSNVGCDQQIRWNSLWDPAESSQTDYRNSASDADVYIDTVTEEGRNLNRWIIGEPSSINPQNLINHDEQFMHHRWPSSVIASATAGSRLEAQGCEPASIASRNNVNSTLNSNYHTANGPSFTLCSNSDSSQNYDINVGILGRVGGDLMECSNSSKSWGLDNKLISSASSSSGPFVPLSGSGGFLVEEDDGRLGRSLDGRRLSCKRKSFEGNVGQTSSSESFFSRTENSIWQVVPPCHDVGSRVNASTPSESSLGTSPHAQLYPRFGLGLEGVTSDSDAPNVARSAESSQRNYRMRTMNPSGQQDSVPNNSFALRSSHGSPDVPPSHQPLRLTSLNPLLGLMSPVLEGSAAPQTHPLALRVPSLQHHMQALRWNGAPSSRPGSSSVAAVSGERDAPLNVDLSSRTMLGNISELAMFTPTTESQYSRRLSEYVGRSLLSSAGLEIAAQGSNILARRSIPASGQEVVSGSGNQGHNQSYATSALYVERQAEGVIGNTPYSFQTLTAAGGRSRLVSEIRNVLNIMRRGEGLRLEDVMILDQTVLFGMVDIHDQHRDMRLDVDNMSYEELLALEERIGNVCTGLTEETILSRMQQHKYVSATMRSDDHTEVEPCCICQEEYNDGEDIGLLDCGHCFHTNCIKQWLARKNLCPICKTTALAT